MSKTLKRFLIILTVLIGAILAIPKLEQADFNADDSTKIYGINTDRENDYENVVKTLGELKNYEELFGVEDWILNNKNVFCIQRNQDIKGSGYWKITKTLEINSNSDNWAKGLAYILDNASTGMVAEAGEGNEHLYKTDKVQLALWRYLCIIGSSKEIEESAKSFFGDVEISQYNDTNEEELTSEEKELVDTAMRICNGQDYDNVNATIHVMRRVKDQNGNEEKITDNQAIIIVEKTNENPEPTPFEFTLEKVDENGNKLKGARFSVQISGIKKVTVDGTDYNDNYSGSIIVDEIKKFTNIKQDPNAKCVTVTVKEITAPDGYEIDPNTYTKYFRYSNYEWQERGRKW